MNFLLLQSHFSVCLFFLVGELLSIALLFLCFFFPPANVLSLKERFLLPQLVLLHSSPFSYAFGATFPQISLKASSVP